MDRRSIILHDPELHWLHDYLEHTLELGFEN
jgi:hypothetical protein